MGGAALPGAHSPVTVDASADSGVELTALFSKTFARF